MSKESTSQSIEVSAVVERKQDDLPRFVVVPSAALAPWRRSGTTVVEVCINETPVERRTIKQWDAGRWFISITASDCRRLGIDTGDNVRLSLGVAPADLPEELAELLRTDERARAAWEQLTVSQQRMLREEVASARQSATRARRARKALVGA